MEIDFSIGNIPAKLCRDWFFGGMKLVTPSESTWLQHPCSPARTFRSALIVLGSALFPDTWSGLKRLVRYWLPAADRTATAYSWTARWSPMLTASSHNP